MAKKNEKSQKITISGLITPCEWDEDDNVVGITLSTTDEEEYRIQNDQVGEELLEYVSRDVMVTGFVDEDEYGDKTLTVKEYEVIDEEEEKEEEEEDLDDYDDEDEFDDEYEIDDDDLDDDDDDDEFDEDDFDEDEDEEEEEGEEY